MPSRSTRHRISRRHRSTIAPCLPAMAQARSTESCFRCSARERNAKKHQYLSSVPTKQFEKKLMGITCASATASSARLL